MRKWVYVICFCMTVLSGCSFDSVENVTISTENMQIEDDGQTYVATFDTVSFGQHISVVGTKLLYMVFNQYEANFYIYDFRTETTEKIKTVSNVALKGGEDVVVGNICYFYMGVYHGNDIKNVLYAVDFVTNEMYSVSDNMYSAKMIPLISINDQVVALQGNNLSNDDADTFLEILHENGDTTRIDLTQNDVGIPVNQDKGPYILSIDSDAENIYAIEMTETGSEKRFFLTKYASDYSCTFVQEITSIFAEYEITTAIGKFYAFGDYFYIKDFSNNAILCKCDDNGIQVLFYGNFFEYVVNFGHNEPFEYFYVKRTNHVYRLNTQTGSFEIQNFDLENEQTVIRCMHAYDKRLMIGKVSSTNSNTEAKKAYLLSCQE